MQTTDNWSPQRPRGRCRKGWQVSGSFGRRGGTVGKLYDEITPELADWLGQQRMFFVATAPLAADGLLNCSPKGMDTFRILGPREVAYLDLTGSGIETIAHLRENGRIVFTFCAFAGPPKIVRLHGTGEVVTRARRTTRGCGRCSRTIRVRGRSSEPA